MTMKASALIAILAFLFSSGQAFDEIINISTPQDLITYSKTLKRTFNYGSTLILQNDIDFTGVSDQYEPISCFYDWCFGGILDGQGYRISNYKSDNGLIATFEGVAIRNVVMDEAIITPNSSSSSRFFGGIAGYASNYHGPAQIENCVYKGKIEVNTPNMVNEEITVGGIAARAVSYHYALTVRNCVNFGTISSSEGAKSVVIGGIIGESVTAYDYSKYYIYNCANYGTIRVTGKITGSIEIGGIVGYNKHYTVNVDNVVNFGTISFPDKVYGRNDYVGALIGYATGTVVTNSYWVRGALYGPIGYGSAITESSSFDSSSFALSKTVLVGNSSVNSLVSALNARVDLYASSRACSKWLLNKSGKKVTFTLNNERALAKTTLKVFMMPDLVNGIEKKFDGWYADSSYSTRLTEFEITSDKTIYGRFE